MKQVISIYFDRAFNDSIHFNTAETWLSKKIPVKIYRMINDKVSGRSLHTHDYVQIWYIIEGCCEHMVKGSKYLLTKGDLFILPPFEVHEIHLVGERDVEIIGCEFLSKFINENINDSYQENSLFDFAYLEPFFTANDMLQPRLHLKGDARKKVETLLLNMMEEFHMEKKYYEISIKADLLKMLSIIAREYENLENADNMELFNKYKSYVNKAIEYINENYTEKICIDDICSISMMSHTYFSYIFKQITGKTCIQYINDLRMNRALELLESGNMNISEICYATGFNDAAYFNKAFKKFTGISPMRFRNLMKKNGKL